jgi:hypothetical protein
MALQIFFFFIKLTEFINLLYYINIKIIFKYYLYFNLLMNFYFLNKQKINSKNNL